MITIIIIETIWVGSRIIEGGPNRPPIDHPAAQGTHRILSKDSSPRFKIQISSWILPLQSFQNKFSQECKAKGQLLLPVFHFKWIYYYDMIAIFSHLAVCNFFDILSAVPVLASLSLFLLKSDLVLFLSRAVTNANSNTKSLKQGGLRPSDSSRIFLSSQRPPAWVIFYHFVFFFLYSTAVWPRNI